MSFDWNRRRRNNQPPCDELGPDDGIDPRILFRNEQPRSRNDRKNHQLAAQAARALQFALGGVCRDPLLQQLDVVSVEPAPDARRLRVIVHAPSDADSIDDVRARLERAHGVLRSAVAQAIRRRKAPELIFDVRPRAEPSS